MVNHCMFVGRTGQNPEVKYTQGGTAFANFSIACSESWKDKQGEKQEKTEWINCTAWGKLAEIIGQYVTKGMLLYVSGKFETQKWDDKEGNTRYKTIINVGEMKMLSGKSDKQGGNDCQPPHVMGSEGIGDDVPFAPYF